MTDDALSGPTGAGITYRSGSMPDGTSHVWILKIEDREGVPDGMIEVAIEPAFQQFVTGVGEALEDVSAFLEEQRIHMFRLANASQPDV